MSATLVLIRGIKSRLRAQNMSYRELARQLGISEPTVKRDLSRGQFSLKRLDNICSVLGVDVSDLLLPPDSAQLTELSEAQEAALVAHPKLLLVTYLVVNDWKFGDIVETFKFSENDLVSTLLSMDKLRIVDFRPPNRVRKLTARNFSWRKTGPVQSFFMRRVLPEFFGSSFDNAGDEFKFMGGTLTPESSLRMQSSLRRLAAEFEQLARHDARLPLQTRESCTLILAMSAWEFSEFSNLRRAPRRRVGRNEASK